MYLQIPAWRPGRYELANFAKNIKNFAVFDDQMKPCTYRKINKDTWEVDTSTSKKITLRYAYYSAELNAGSTFIDDSGKKFSDRVGKAGRVESAIDPAPISMFENIINYKPEFIVTFDGKPKRFKVDHDDMFVLSNGTSLSNDDALLQNIKEADLLADNRILCRP